MPNDYVTKAEFNAAIGGVGVRFSAIDKRFNEVDQRFAAMDRRFDAMDRRFDSLTEMVGNIAVELTAMNLFLKEHIKQQGMLHSRIDQRLDTLEAV